MNRNEEEVRASVENILGAGLRQLFRVQGADDFGLSADLVALVAHVATHHAACCTVRRLVEEIMDDASHEWHGVPFCDQLPYCKHRSREAK